MKERNQTKLTKRLKFILLSSCFPLISTAIIKKPIGKCTNKGCKRPKKVKVSKKIMNLNPC